MESSLTSQASLATAGIALIQKCAAGTPSKGGVAKDIGGDNKLGLLLTGYRPQVQCSGRVSPTQQFRKSCQGILDTMDVTDIPQKFGPPTDPGGVDVTLPVSLKAGYLERCIITLRTTGISDEFSWLEVWEAATAINAICIRFGKQGKWENLGSSDRLSLEITDDSDSQARL